MDISIESSLQSCIESIKNRGSDHDEVSFQIIDLGEIYRQHLRWSKHLPKIHPYYGNSSVLPSG